MPMGLKRRTLDAALGRRAERLAERLVREFSLLGVYGVRWAIRSDPAGGVRLQIASGRGRSRRALVRRVIDRLAGGTGGEMRRR